MQSRWRTRKTWSRTGTTARLWWAARHAEVLDDLPGDLVALQRDGAEITDHEIASFCYSLLTAGHETTTNLIANGLLALLQHHEAWTALVADKAKIPGAIEEILRYAQSVVAWRRKVKAVTSIAGVQIPEGADLLLLLASANRDEQVFAKGEQFDIERENARAHISFGYGIHFCPGSSLAKMQLQIVIEELTARDWKQSDVRYLHEDRVMGELHTEAGLRIARQDLACSRRLLQIGLL